ncbi:MAG: helix-turn-helix transcriptional regulator [Desulfosporosinus sp.]|nr:helix-turn-helix transcriptional regulator [Desulfosporosinus sp.]
MKEERDEEKEQFIKQFEAGRLLKGLRGDRPLSEVCKLLSVSTAYLSEVERGKMPSDHFLTVAAKVYEVKEDELFSAWGKIPILAQKEVTNNPTLLTTLAQIGREKLSDEEKEDLYDMIFKVYREFIDKKKKK